MDKYEVEDRSRLAMAIALWHPANHLVAAPFCSICCSENSRANSKLGQHEIRHHACLFLTMIHQFHCEEGGGRVTVPI